ncbi:MAG: hypothetical protein E6Q67_05035 [Roseateles sp.]|nr:MAG: hypothetical protein E6Q67_05035 [Roseateles sp.]
MSTAHSSTDLELFGREGSNGASESAHAVATVARVSAALKSYRYSFSSEFGLHEGMAEALTRAGIAFEQEVVAGSDRFDFLVDGGIVIEAKIKRSMPEALAQCMRYAQRDDVRAVVLAASRFWAHVVVGDTIAGKPFMMVKLARSF